MRPVILHYHLFKNAGTSIDACLEQSFGERWHTFDSPVGHTLCADQLAAYIEQHPELLALSSHDAAPPIPNGDFKVFPIVFLRHPILRAKSAYLFESGVQQGKTTSSSGFREYIRQRLAEPNGSVVTNFQACRLANQSFGGPDQLPPDSEDDYADRACRFIDSLDFFGLVEEFAESLARMKNFLQLKFPDIQLENRWHNATERSMQPVAQRIEAIAAELGAELFQPLMNRNRQDLRLYDHAAHRFHSPRN